MQRVALNYFRLQEEEPLYSVAGAQLFAGLKRTNLLESPYELNYQLNYVHEKRKAAETLLEHGTLAQTMHFLEGCSNLYSYQYSPEVRSLLERAFRALLLRVDLKK